MKLDHLSFEAAVILGTAEIPFLAYLDLQIGDIIILDQSTEKGLPVRVGEQNYFSATAGLFETHKAVTLDERILHRRD